MKNFSGEDKQEMIKALAAGMTIIDIANFANVSEVEIQQFAKDNAKAILKRKKAMEEFGI